jgi:hypothetical protein
MLPMPRPEDTKMKRFAWHTTLACGLALGCLLGGIGCSRIVVTAADREQSAEYLKDRAIQSLFPEKLKNLELAMVDEQSGLPEFDFAWNGYRGVYQKGGQQMEVLVLEKMGRRDLKQLHDSILQTALDNGDNPERLRFNNASYTYWSGDGQVYRFYPLQGDVVVFRTTRNVSELPLVKDYLRQRMMATDSLAAAR